MRAYIPPLKPIPEGATQADRERMFEEYKAELCRLNPHMHHPDGSLKSFTALGWVCALSFVFICCLAVEGIPWI